jgi:hypothetical protein
VIRLAVREVRPEHLDLLRRWMAEIDGPRRREALATLVDEGCHHETALLIEGRDGPLLVYAMEVDDVARSVAAARDSPHPIDAEHRSVMTTALGADVAGEVLLDLR